VEHGHSGKGKADHMPERLVIVGGDAAGMSAATQARRRRDAAELQIIAFERGPYTSYSACGIPYYIGDTVKELETLIVRSPDAFRQENGIEAHVHHEVTGIDLDARKVTVRDLETSTERAEGFDMLVVATGATPIKPDWPGIDSSSVFGVQVLEDGVAIRRWVDDEKPSRAVVVGGGYIGIEMAEALKMRGLHVVLVDGARQPMSTLDEDMGAVVAERMRAMGIELYLDEKVTAIEQYKGRASAVVTEERNLPADIVVLGIGVQANVELAERAGIEIGTSGGISVDRGMRTSADGVWSAGDCAEKFHLVSRRGVSVPLGTHANKEGRVAGINIGGGYDSFPGVVGTAASKVCDVEVARTGLNESEAAEAGFQFVADTSDSSTQAGYFPDTRPIKTKLVVEKQSGRLLGAQIIGGEGAAKRIDVFATALWNRMTVGEMLNLDLAYAPPFAPVWDPVLIAARKAWRLVEETLQVDPE
jgi:NADPH-dependent 2,4-dienoyl-CoA reductase/sulfur reductase-like enzyme